MHLEHEPRKIDQLQLSPTQSEVAHSILDTLQLSSPDEQQMLIVLKGPSGIGKSAILTHIQDQIEKHHGLVVEPEDIRYPATSNKTNLGSSHLVTTTSLTEFSGSEPIEKAATKQFPNIITFTINLTGMSQAEITEYLANLPAAQKATLPTETITSYSMGIPLLARQLITPELDETMARQIASQYLKQAFSESRSDRLATTTQRHLQMPIPDPVLQSFQEAMTRLTTSTIYSNLFWALKKREELHSQGIFEESPLFIAPESENIYNQMLQSDNSPRLDIFVPVLSPTDFERLNQAFGLSWGRFLGNVSTRSSMFLAHYRKVTFWSRELDGSTVEEIGEDWNLQKAIQGYWELYRTHQLQLPPSSEPTASYFIHSHEHDGLNTAPARIGWMTESLLQQRGISYFANNFTQGSSYVYVPEEQRIVFLPQPVSDPRFKY